MTWRIWTGIFESIPKGEIIAETLVDSVSGDIIGQDKETEFKLLGTGIYMHVEESCGGGIIYWTGNKYNWYHIE